MQIWNLNSKPVLHKRHNPGCILWKATAILFSDHLVTDLFSAFFCLFICFVFFLLVLYKWGELYLQTETCQRARRRPKDILRRIISTEKTFTSILSPSCSLALWSRLCGIRPSMPTPISTKAPKWVTFCTRPVKIAESVIWYLDIINTNSNTQPRITQLHLCLISLYKAHSNLFTEFFSHNYRNKKNSYYFTSYLILTIYREAL